MNFIIIEKLKHFTLKKKQPAVNPRKFCPMIYCEVFA